jgi:predicted ester cyclase
MFTTDRRGDKLSAEENKKTVEQFMDRVVAGRDLAAVDDTCTADVIMRLPNGVSFGQRGVKSFLDKTAEALPGYQITFDFCVAEGDRVACRAVLRGTFAHDYEDLKANGRRLVLPQMWIFRFAGGSISEMEVVYDTRLGNAQLETPPPRVFEK